MSSFQVPYLKPRELDGFANELLGRYARKTGKPIAAPIPAEPILEKYLGLTIAFRNLEKELGQPGLLGATWIDKELVWFDDSLQDGSGRFHFTVAHEIGHWQMHRPLMIVEREMPVLFDYIGDGSPPPNIVCRASERKEPMEWQADQFAARLLMPKALMREAFQRLFPEGLQLPKELRAVEREEDRREWLNKVALEMVRSGGFSNCSREAMRIRIEGLKLVDCSGSRPLL